MRERLYLSLLVGVLLCLAGWTARAQLQRSGPARHAWEYKSWVFRTSVGRAELYEDGKLVPGATPVTRAPEVGAQGWELVSIACDDACIYWFKRPR